MFLADALMLALGIGIIVLLIVIFFVSYFYNKKTPIPKGCEQIAYDVQSCSGCHEVACEYHIRAEELLQKMKEELKEENK